MHTEIFSRPARLAAWVTGMTEETVKHLFTQKRILIRLEASFCEILDARETFLFAVNQALRFCPNISICVEGDGTTLIETCNVHAGQIYGPKATVEVVKDSLKGEFDAIVIVGSEVLAGRSSATVNSGGWVARLATGNSGVPLLPWHVQRYNPLGALAAACLGVGAAFLTILGRPITTVSELSLFTYQVGNPGTLDMGPSLPDSPLCLDAFLVGCGAVANGWAYAVKRLPIEGRLEAIDRQSLRYENLGSYVAAGRNYIDKPKAHLIKDLLSPAINVIERSDQWEFFKIRLRNELKVPPLIIAGLDNVTTRHSVQRLWPETLIDMGAGRLESQVIVKRGNSNGQCLLNALTVPKNEGDWVDNLSRITGLQPETILNEPTGEITQADIDAAPVEKQCDLKRNLGKPRCGHINRQTLELEGYAPDFEPAVPFVTAFSGIVGAAETMKWLTGARFSHSVHFQKSFQSARSRCLEMKCDPKCECQSITESTF